MLLRAWVAWQDNNLTANAEMHANETLRGFREPETTPEPHLFHVAKERFRDLELRQGLWADISADCPIILNKCSDQKLTNYSADPCGFGIYIKKKSFYA